MVTLSQGFATSDNEVLEADYEYRTTEVSLDQAGFAQVKAILRKIQFRTTQQVPKTGVMMVGWGGNNGTTLTAGLLANKGKLSFETRRGTVQSNFYGSLTQCATSEIGRDAQGNPVVCAFKDLLPMVSADSLVVGGWDFNRADMLEATKRAQVLEPDLIRQLAPELKKLVPLPGVYDPIFVAPNQKDRANNTIGGTKSEQLAKLREDIREFKRENSLESVVVLWTANTERYALVVEGVNDTADNLLRAIENGHEEIAPSTLYAVAAILEGSPYINGSPQNTFVPGLIELAERREAVLVGDDFKTGQTKIKSVLSDFLVSSGIRLASVVSYNHLGNNDGFNLSHEACFRSKEISKSGVIDDIIHSNPILYPQETHPDHVVVIKYVPAVGDSKRALDEYESEIFLGGRNTISLHNVCEDSLLAAPLMLDLIILTELFTRITLRADESKEFTRFHTILAPLAFLVKAPRVPNGAQVVNVLFRQRECLEGILRAARGLPPVDHLRVLEKL